MEARFSRSPEDICSTTALRDDGVLLAIPPAGASRILPHDLAHFAVEAGLGLRQGFWGCLAAEGLISGVKILEGRQRPHAAQRSKQVLKDAGQHLTEAEILVKTVGDITARGLDRSAPGQACALVQQAWAPHGAPPRKVDRERLEAACRGLREAKKEWDALPRGGTLVCLWPVPRAGSTRRR